MTSDYRHAGGQVDLRQHQEFLALPINHQYCHAFHGGVLDSFRTTTSPHPHTNFVDQYHHGRPACTEFRYRNHQLRYVSQSLRLRRSFLGVEPLDKDVMKKPPRDPRKPVFTPLMVGSIALSALLMVVGTLGVFYAFLQVRCFD